MENKKYIIYIVEDSTIIAEILQKVVSSIPEVEAKGFSCGETMLEEFYHVIPDMVFLDYYLFPEGRKISGKGEAMNGEMIFQEIKKKYSNIPVVLLTGMSDEQKIQELKNIGFCCVILKNEDDIYTSVINCVNKFLLKK